MRRADEGVALAHGVAELRRYSKVCHFHFTRLRQQNVATFDVPVNLQTQRETLQMVLTEVRIAKLVLHPVACMFAYQMHGVKHLQGYLVNDCCCC